MILRLPLKLNARIGGDTPGALTPHANPLLDWSVRAFDVGRTEYVHLPDHVVVSGRGGWSAAASPRRSSARRRGSTCPRPPPADRTGT